MPLSSEMEHSTNNTLERLGLLLNIPDLGGEDWDLIFADPGRVAEFCDVYERGELSADEKAALMELIVASYDQNLRGANHQSGLESRISGLLTEDFELHKNTIEYWSKLKSHNPAVLWKVSPLMRKILRERVGEA